jgi:hypothetical protein
VDEPDDVRALAKTAEAIFRRPAFPRELSDKSLVRSTEFSWSRADGRYADHHRSVERSAEK